MNAPEMPALAGMTLAEKIGQLVLAALPGPTLDAGTAALFRERHLGGVILFARNIVSVAQTRALTRRFRQRAHSDAGLPALIGADQEGGRVLRTAALPEATAGPPRWRSVRRTIPPSRSGSARRSARNCARSVSMWRSPPMRM